MTKFQQKICQEVEKHREEIIKFTQKLVQTPSVSGVNPEKEVAKLIFDKTKKFDLNPKYIFKDRERPNIVAFYGHGKKSLLLNGHMDTVAVGEESRWKYPPFSGKIVKVLKKNAKLILKMAPEVKVAGGACDAYLFINGGIPTISGFGPKGDNLHALDEYVEIESLIDLTKIYALTALDFLK